MKFGPENCVSLTRSKEGSCVISTNCEGVDISDIRFTCWNDGKGAVYSVRDLGLKNSAEFTQVKCRRCEPPPQPQKPEAPVAKKAVGDMKFMKEWSAGVVIAVAASCVVGVAISYAGFGGARLVPTIADASMTPGDRASGHGGVNQGGVGGTGQGFNAQAAGMPAQAGGGDHAPGHGNVSQGGTGGTGQGFNAQAPGMPAQAGGDRTSGNGGVSQGAIGATAQGFNAQVAGMPAQAGGDRASGNGGVNQGAGGMGQGFNAQVAGMPAQAGGFGSARAAASTPGFGGAAMTPGFAGARSPLSPRRVLSFVGASSEDAAAAMTTARSSSSLQHTMGHFRLPDPPVTIAMAPLLSAAAGTATQSARDVCSPPAPLPSAMSEEYAPQSSIVSNTPSSQCQQDTFVQATAKWPQIREGSHDRKLGERKRSASRDAGDTAMTPRKRPRTGIESPSRTPSARPPATPQAATQLEEAAGSLEEESASGLRSGLDIHNPLLRPGTRRRNLGREKPCC